MNSVAFVGFTRAGCALARRLADGLPALPGYRGVRTTVHGPARFGMRDFGELGPWTAARFVADDALVFVGATGIAVRAIAPCVRDKFSDPAVVCIDEAGRFAVPLLSGHVGGANSLARALASITAGQAVISTATDVNGAFAVDEWAARRGLRVVERELAKEISARLLEGGEVGYAIAPGGDALPEGPVPGEEPAGHGGASACGAARAREGLGAMAGELQRAPQLVRWDASAPAGACDLGFAIGLDEGWHPFGRTLHLVPPAVTVGVGCRKGLDPAVLERAVDEALAQARVSARAVRCLATIDVKRGEPAIVQLAGKRGWELRCYPADALRSVPGTFADSPFVEQAVGVGNVCERAALVQGGTLLLGKQARDGATVAVGLAPWGAGTCQSALDEGRAPASENTASESPAPANPAAANPAAESPAPGKLAVVGIGPGGGLDLTGRARQALAACDVLVGYPVYVDLVQGEFPGKEVFTTPMRQEVERCRKALQLAAGGRDVALVCSGDAGVYGMAGPVLELAGEYPGVQVEIVSGVSAANGGAAVLGAPLMHDWCCISLSDLLTPWEAIERRLEAAAGAGMPIVLYNPASRKRPDHLERACGILLRSLPPETVCGIVRNIGRAGQESRVLSLAELREAPADMFTTVFVGNSQTRELEGRMVTPRGYRIGAGRAEGRGVRGEGRALQAAAGVPCADADLPTACGPQPGGGPRKAEILLFGGTVEGRNLAEWLSQRGRSRVVACCATDYGGELVSGLPGVSPMVGPLGDAEKERLLAEHGFACIVDATHPFATHVSASLERLAREHGIPLLRLVRADERPGDFTLVESMGEAAELAARHEGNILLTTGTRDLETFVRAVDGFAERLYVRVLPVPESVAAARALGVPASRIVAMQGPFSTAMNQAMLRELDISLLVTKASGAAGGFAQKIEAARACGVQAVVVGRPAAEEGFSLEGVKRELEVRYGA